MIWFFARPRRPASPKPHGDGAQGRIAENVPKLFPVAEKRIPLNMRPDVVENHSGLNQLRGDNGSFRIGRIFRMSRDSERLVEATSSAIPQATRLATIPDSRRCLQGTDCWLFSRDRPLWAFIRDRLLRRRSVFPGSPLAKGRPGTTRFLN